MAFARKKGGVLTFEECTTRRTGPLETSPLANAFQPAWTHLYLAGGAGRENSFNCLFAQNYKNILISYFYLRQMLKRYGGSMEKWIDANGWNFDGIRLMMDSGAYSAKTQGKPIPHEEYLEFVAKNLDYISVPVMMDTVLDPKATEEAYKVAQKSGIKFMYAFHRPEPWEYFDRHLGEPYIGLAPMPKSAPSVKVEWFGKCLHRAGMIPVSEKVLFPPKGRFNYKSSFHLLGSAAERVIAKIEAVSADSSSWSMSVGVHASTRTPHGTVCWFKKPKTEKTNMWHKLHPDKQAKIADWIFECTGLEAHRLLVEGSMNWNLKNSPNLPLARINIEHAKLAEIEANRAKQANPDSVYVPSSPDFSVVDDAQMKDTPWS